MGLRALDFADWLKPQPGDQILLAERAKLIESNSESVIAALPTAENAIAELSDILSDRFSEDEEFGAATEYLKFIGTRLAEDVCVLSLHQSAYRLSAAVLCFPNRWKLQEKMGRTVTEIHQPVPEYGERASVGVDRFLKKLRPLRAFERSNWGIVLSPALYHPDLADPIKRGDLSRSFLRVETQGFLKLPETKAVIFSIRTSVVPWRDLPCEKQNAIAREAHALSSEWQTYKALELANTS